MKKILLCGLILGLSSSVFAAGQETLTAVTKKSTGDYITTIRDGFNTELAKQQRMNTELYAVDLLKANISCFESEAAFNACFSLDWPTGGSMTWPATAGIMVYGGSSAWGTSLTLDTDLSSVSSNDDSVPSAKATKSALDAKASSTGIAFVASSLSDLKYDPDTEVADDEYAIITNTGSVGDANAATVAPTLERAGVLFQAKDDDLDDDAIEFVIDGGGSAITTGVKGFLEIPYNATINRATIVCDQSGSIVIDVWKDSYANYPPTDADSITSSAVPTISAATKAQDTTLTGWTTSLSSGDFVGFNVDSASTVTRCTISLKVTK